MLDDAEHRINMLECLGLKKCSDHPAGMNPNDAFLQFHIDLATTKGKSTSVVARILKQRRNCVIDFGGIDCLPV